MKKIILFSIIVGFLLYSCQHNEDIGWEIYPPDEEISGLKVDTFTIIAYTQKTDSVRSDRTAQSLAGIYVDPIFGTTYAAFCTQLNLPTTSVVFPQDIIVDSLVLHLEYFYIYGFPKENNLITYQVRELVSNVKDTIYYSNNPFEVGQLLGSATVTPDLQDSVYINNRRFPAQLRIKLSNQFAKKIVEAAHEGLLYNNATFTSFIKGIAILPVYEGGTGCLASFDVTSNNSGMTLFYRTNGENRSYTFKITKTTPRYTFFSHNYQYSHPDLISQLNGDTTIGQKILFLQSMAGTKVIIKFPGIHNFLNGKVIINQAKLVIPIEATDHTSNTYPVPKIISILRINSKGQFEATLDYGASSSELNKPNYDANNKFYSLLFTLELQNIIKKHDSTATYALMVNGNAVNPHRVVLSGPQNLIQPMKLIVYYTPIK
ncbi:MAG: DUF4270 domain-containing protein [Bacteroidales bacterium]|nr:DUF4270 domain-containing protein [Bacteroidales bacterium]